MGSLRESAMKVATPEYPIGSQLRDAKERLEKRITELCSCRTSVRLNV